MCSNKIRYLARSIAALALANIVRKDSGGFRKFASDDATLLTLGCTDASIVPLSLNRSVAYAIKQTGKKAAKRRSILPARRKYTSRAPQVYFPKTGGAAHHTAGAGLSDPARRDDNG